MSPRPGRRRVLHLICQAHLDPVWLWPCRDGMAEALTTIQSAVDRAREFPDFRFTRSSVEIYRWVRETDPRLFAEVRRLVRARRWEVVGGWVEQPDCNLPSGESFVRQSLLGQAWLREHLGRTATIGYNVDSFGHAGGLPQLLRRAGFTHYVFMRPQRHEAPEVPDLFWWEGDDGSRVLTQRVPGQYCQRPDLTADELEALIRTTAAGHFSPGFDQGVFWLGIGNHGGGPTREHLARIRELQRDESLPVLRFSTLAEYFSAIARGAAYRKLPTVRSELQFHARGCYVATSEVKLLNRRAERALFVADALAAANLAPAPQPSRGRGRSLREAWWQLLFNQFHDILAGTCVASTWDETRDRFGATLHTAERVAQQELHRMARRVDTSGEPGSVLFAFNPLPWPRKGLVQLDTFMDPHGRAPITHLETRAGARRELQWMPAEANYGPHLRPWGKLTAVVDLPAGGYVVHRLAAGGGPGKAVAPSSRFRLNRARAGGIGSWRTAEGKEILAGPIGFGLLSDPSDTWAHDVRTFGWEEKPPRMVGERLVSTGPVCRAWRQRFVCGRSEVWLDVIEHSWTTAVEFCVRMDWRERRRILVLQIPTRVRGGQFVAKTPAGVAVRKPDGEEQPGHEWTAVTGRFGRATHTVGLVNAQSYSHACLGGTLRVLLARGARFAEHDPRRVERAEPKPWTDHGWQERRFWLVEGPGDWRAVGIDRRAAELLAPVPAMLDSAHPGTAPWEQSFGRFSGKGVALLAWKPAEDAQGMIVRLQEMHGRARLVELEFPHARASGRIRFRPWEIKTVRIRPGGQIGAATLLEAPEVT